MFGGADMRLCQCLCMLCNVRLGLSRKMKLLISQESNILVGSLSFTAKDPARMSISQPTRSLKGSQSVITALIYDKISHVYMIELIDIYKQGPECCL